MLGASRGPAANQVSLDEQVFASQALLYKCRRRRAAITGEDVGCLLSLALCFTERGLRPVLTQVCVAIGERDGVRFGGIGLSGIGLGLGGVGLDWVGLDCGLAWVGLVLVGLGWVGLGRVELGWGWWGWVGFGLVLGWIWVGWGVFGKPLRGKT